MDLAGLRRFQEKETVEYAGLEARIDSPAWSMMAWVKLPVGGGARIIRKAQTWMQKDKLSCWSWYVGAPQDRLDFGAHDFRGGSFTSALQVGALRAARHDAECLWFRNERCIRKLEARLLAHAVER